MKALILCGGKGTRLRPLTYTRSKQLIPVANKPIVEYVLSHIIGAGIKDIGVIVAPETQNEIKDFFSHSDMAHSDGVKINYILQDQPAGLAHAVKTASKFLGDEPFVMYLGDNLLKDEISANIQSFTENNLDALVSLKEVEDARNFGVAVLDAKGNINRLIEKPKEPVSNLALVGVYIFSPKIHQAIEQIKPSWRGELEITDAIQKLIELKGHVQGKILKGWWLDTGKKDDLLSANSIVLDDFVRKEIRGTIDQKSHITGRVFIDEGSEVTNSTIRGPVVIGKNVRVTDSFVGPYSSIGDDTQIIESSVEHVVILRKATIRGISRLEDSLVGEDTQVFTNAGKHKAVRLMVGDSASVEV